MSDTPLTDKAFVEAYNQNSPEFGEGWQGFSEDIQKAMREMELERAEAIKIARTAIETIESIYAHSQYCDECESFEIAQQGRNQLHGFDRLNALCNT